MSGIIPLVVIYMLGDQRRHFPASCVAVDLILIDNKKLVRNKHSQRCCVSAAYVLPKTCEVSFSDTDGCRNHV